MTQANCDQIIFDWITSGDPGRKPPPNVEAAYRQRQRNQEADEYVALDHTDHVDYNQHQLALYDAVNDRKTKYCKHRHIEALLADYIDRAIVRHQTLTFDEMIRARLIVKKLQSCRKDGVFGVNDAGKFMVAWDQKCGLAKLCPDEALNEGRRLAEKYGHELTLQKLLYGKRVYKCWLTLPNYPPDRLAEGKKEAFKRFRAMLRMQHRGKPLLNIKGALVVQEDPLGDGTGWNVHLNVILVSNGWLNFQTLRKAWSAHAHLLEHTDFSDAGRAGLFNEMIKYPARAVSEKSLEHADTGKSTAPGMIDWPSERFIEWWRANTGFRRTRAYGCLYNVPAPAKETFLGVTWLGRLRWSGAGYDVQWSKVRRVSDLILIREDKLTTDPPARRTTGPP